MQLCYFFREKKNEWTFFHAKKVLFNSIFNWKKSVGLRKFVLNNASEFSQINWLNLADSEEMRFSFSFVIPHIRMVLDSI